VRGGGKDRADYDNYSPDRYLQDDDPDKVMGCHKGPFAILNVKNPVPGWTYAHASSDPRKLHEARINRWQVIQADDPERLAAEEVLGYDNNNDMDSTRTGMPGVVFVKRSPEDERRVREEEAKRHSQLLRDGDAETNYTSRATAQEQQQGGKRLIRDDHRTYATNGQDAEGPQTDSWTPRR